MDVGGDSVLNNVEMVPELCKEGNAMRSLAGVRPNAIELGVVNLGTESAPSVIGGG